MTKPAKRYVFWAFAGLCFLAALPCFYEAVDLGVTAEEGRNYTVPHVPDSAPEFRAKQLQADRWADAFGGAVVLSFVFGFAGWRVRN